MANVFNVLTEFRFDIAHAVAGSQTLQNEVGKISDAANNAMYNIQRMGAGLVAQMGLGSGGILGFLYTAIQASDKFAQSQRNLANILLSNNEVFKNGGFDFAGAMGQSEAIMNNVIQKAREFALDPNVLMESVKAISPVLLSHRLEASSQLPMSIDIARGFLKSAPTLGIDPNLAMGQLTDLAMGRANMGDRLFQRLVSETAPMRNANITSSQAFNVLPAQKRIELLRQSLLQFGSNADVLRGNMMSLNGQLQVFTSLIKGQFSIFRSIGNVIIEPLKRILNSVNNYLMTKGKTISDNIAKIIEPFIRDPEALLATIMQMGKLKSDMKMAGEILGFIGLISGIKEVLKFFGIQVGGFLTFGRVLSFLGSVVTSVMTVLKTIFPALKNVGVFLVRSVFLPILLFTTVLQGISRGIAQAKIADAKWIADHMDKITDLMNKFSIIAKKFLLPITLAIDGIASIVEWFLTFGTITEKALGWADTLLTVFNAISNIIVGFFAVVSAVIAPIVRNIASLMNGNVLDIFTTNNAEIFGTMKEGFMDFWSKYATPLDQVTKDQAVSQANINIGSIEINNAFKEQSQPDRIAFTLKEQILKTAMNPQQAQGRSLRGALTQ